MLVPMVSVISAATVTCFLIAYRDNYVFAVAMSVWVVAGIVSLAAITGGVALLGRLAQLQFGMEEEVDEDEEKPVRQTRWSRSRLPGGTWAGKNWQISSWLSAAARLQVSPGRRDLLA